MPLLLASLCVNINLIFDLFHAVDMQRGSSASIGAVGRVASFSPAGFGFPSIWSYSQSLFDFFVLPHHFVSYVIGLLGPLPFCYITIFHSLLLFWRRGCRFFFGPLPWHLRTEF